MVGNASGYTVVACCGMILFLVLRRSMLHAIGFTYSEIVPLHRWLGAAIVGWSTIHTAGYMIFLGSEGRLQSDINFYDMSRGTLNMMGVFAYVSIFIFVPAQSTVLPPFSHLTKFFSFRVSY